jgi:hypothetical protein
MHNGPTAIRQALDFGTDGSARRELDFTDRKREAAAIGTAPGTYRTQPANVQPGGELALNEGQYRVGMSPRPPYRVGKNVDDFHASSSNDG